MQAVHGFNLLALLQETCSLVQILGGLLVLLILSRSQAVLKSGLCLLLRQLPLLLLLSLALSLLLLLLIKVFCRVGRQELLLLSGDAVLLGSILLSLLLLLGRRCGLLLLDELLKHISQVLNLEYRLLILYIPLDSKRIWICHQLLELLFK